jgi:hypothetical protein
MVLPEMVLTIIFWNTSQYGCHVAVDVMNVGKSLSPQGTVLILQRSKNHRGPSQVNEVDGPFL